MLHVAAISVVLVALSAGGFWLWRWQTEYASFGPPIELIADASALQDVAISREARLPAGWGGTPNIVLISVDTLRADHLGTYGYSRDTSRRIDALATDGITFDRAFVTTPKTTPSLTSLLSGLTVKTHRVHALQIPLNESISLLPEILQKMGYATAGFCGQYNCSRKWGLGRGFDHYDDDFNFSSHEPATQSRRGGGFHPSSERRAGYLVDQAIRWIESLEKSGEDTRAESPRNPAAPFFTWLHLMDPHAGYSPPEGYQGLFSGQSKFSQNSFEGERIPDELIHSQAKREGVDAYDDYINLYDAEIRYTDDQVGRFFTFLKQKGLYDDALIVFTSDHGEYMGEGSGGETVFSHGDTLFDSEIWVPLIVKLPGKVLAATRSDRLVSLADVVPTLLSYVGHQGAHTEGRSLMDSLSQPGAVAPRRVVFSQRSGRGSFFSARSRDHKLIFKSKRSYLETIERLRQQRSVWGRYQLYDLREDPLERDPLALGHEAIAAELSVELANWLASSIALDFDLPREITLDDETTRHLRHLGYVE